MYHLKTINENIFIYFFSIFFLKLTFHKTVVSLYIKFYFFLSPSGNSIIKLKRHRRDFAIFIEYAFSIHVETKARSSCDNSRALDKVEPRGHIFFLPISHYDFLNQCTSTNYKHNLEIRMKHFTT